MNAPYFPNGSIRPFELENAMQIFLSAVQQNAWSRHPEVAFAEIKRFYIALLRAIQQPVW
jgi:hypothetical protein